MPVLVVAAAIAAIVAFGWATSRPRRNPYAGPVRTVSEVEARIRALGLDPSRIDEGEAQVIIEGAAAVVAANGSEAALASDPRFANMLATLEANYSVAELQSAMSHLGVVVVP